MTHEDFGVFRSLEDYQAAMKEGCGPMHQKRKRKRGKPVEEMTDLDVYLAGLKGSLDESMLRRSKAGMPYPPKAGYTVGVTYETWDEDALEAGDTDDKGWEVDRTKVRNLKQALEDEIPSHISWLEWSSSHVTGRGEWVVSQEDENFRTGERTIYHLHIARADRQPLTKDEVTYISERLGLRGWRWAGRK